LASVSILEPLPERNPERLSLGWRYPFDEPRQGSGAVTAAVEGLAHHSGAVFLSGQRWPALDLV
jgi:hypothetical protein